MHPRLAPLRRVIGAHSPARLALKARTDAALDRLHERGGQNRRLDRLADAMAPVDVLVVAIDGRESRLSAAVEELRRSRHRVRVAVGTLAEAPTPGLERETVRTGMRGGKFENLNALLAEHAGASPRWTLAIDHDVRLPPRFLDRFLAACEAFDLALAQPALTLRSYHSHRITRRRPLAFARETWFVEIGPLTAIRDDAAAELLPFPDGIGMGWGLDRHWPAVARAHGWRMGVVDATPVGHEDRPAGAGYSGSEAQASAECWLARHAMLTPEDAHRTTRVHLRLPVLSQNR